MRDIASEVGDTVIIGISPDKPAKLKKFDEKYGLWVEKKNYGKTYMACSGPHS